MRDKYKSIISFMYQYKNLFLFLFLGLVFFGMSSQKEYEVFHPSGSKILSANPIAEITFSKSYNAINLILFTTALILLLYISAKIIYNYHKKTNNNAKQKILFVSVLLFSFFFVFVTVKQVFFGRFLLLPVTLYNIFEEGQFRFYSSQIQKTPLTFFYSIIQEFFHVNVTPDTVLFVNKLLAVLLLVVIFYLAKSVFNKNGVSFLILVIYVSSSYVQSNVSSIEYIIGAILCVHLSIFFLIKYMKEHNKLLFVASNLALILAAYQRKEITFLFGIPYLLFYSLFLYKIKNLRTSMTITTGILTLIFLGAVGHFTTLDDPAIYGDDLKEKNLLSFVANSIFILKHNIITLDGFSLGSGFITVFTYSGLFGAFLFSFYLIAKRWKGKETSDFDKKIALFAFYSLFSFIVLLALNREAFMGWKHSVHFFFSEIVITFFLLGVIIDRINNKKNLRKKLKTISFIAFFIVAYLFSNPLTFKIEPTRGGYYEEMRLIQDTITLNKDCAIIKAEPRQPLLDIYFYPLKNTLFVWGEPLFYENLRNIEKKGNCYYYMDQEYIDNNEVLYNGLSKLNTTEVTEIFSSCKKEIVVDNTISIRPFSIYKYVC